MEQVCKGLAATGTVGGQRAAAVQRCRHQHPLYNATSPAGVPAAPGAAVGGASRHCPLVRSPALSPQLQPCILSIMRYMLERYQLPDSQSRVPPPAAAAAAAAAGSACGVVKGREVGSSCHALQRAGARLVWRQPRRACRQQWRLAAACDRQRHQDGHSIDAKRLHCCHRSACAPPPHRPRPAPCSACSGMASTCSRGDTRSSWSVVHTT